MRNGVERSIVTATALTDAIVISDQRSVALTAAICSIVSGFVEM